MKQIKVTAAQAILLQVNNWAIVNGDALINAYLSRDEARTAKKEQDLVGSIIKTSELELEIITAATEPVTEVPVVLGAPLTDPTEAANQPAEDASHPVKPWGYEIHGLTHCPNCGIHLDNGIGEHLQDVNGKHIKHEKYQFECLACGTEFGPEIEPTADKKPTKKIEITHKSTVDRPCGRVWDIADSMPGAKRKDILQACVDAGIAYYTARTQYQMLLTVRKEEAAREAAQKAAETK